MAKSQTSTNTNNGLAEKDVFDVLFNQDLFPKNNNNNREVGNEFSYDTYNTDQTNNKASQNQNLYGNNVNNVAFEQTIGQEFNVGNGHKSNGYGKQPSNENLRTDTNVKTSGNEMNTKPPTIRKRPLTNKHNSKSVPHFFTE